MNNILHSIKKFFNIQNIVVVILFCVTAILIINSMFKTAFNTAIDFDGAWNASVARNFAKILEYRTTTPNKIFFEPKISTGEPLILLAALSYKILGISYFTTLVPQMIFVVILIFLSYKIYRFNNFKILYSIFISLFILFNYHFFILINTLYGEVSSTCYCLLAIFLMQRYLNKNLFFPFLIGILLALAYKTKIIMVFFCISILGILFLDSIFVKNIKFKEFVLILIGIVTTLLAFFDFRVKQFDGNTVLAKESIKKYFTEMFTQSTMSYVGEKNIYTLSDKVLRLKEIFNNSNIGVIIEIIIIPILLYVMVLFNKKIKERINRYDIIIIYMGVAASSIFVYYMIFGTGAYNGKRLYPYVFLLQLALLYLCFWLLNNLYELFIKLSLISKVKIDIIFSICMVLFAIVVFSNVDLISFMERYIKNNNVKYEKKLADVFYDTIENLPDDSVYVIFGNPVPQVDLYYDKNIQNIVEMNEKDIEKYRGRSVYLLISNVWATEVDIDDLASIYKFKYERVNTNKINYELFYSVYRHNSIDLYSVYKLNFL